MKLSYAFNWVAFETILKFSIQVWLLIVDTKQSIPIFYNLIEVAMTVLIVIVLVYSKLKNKEATIVALLISLFQYHFIIYKHDSFLEVGNEQSVYLTTLITLIPIIFNDFLLALLYEKLKLVIHLFNAGIVLVGIIKRFTDFAQKIESIQFTLFLLIPPLWCIAAGHTLLQMQNIYIDQHSKLINIIKQLKAKKNFSNENNEIFQNLDEGIIVMQNGAINFSNQLFKEILKSMNVVTDTSVKLTQAVMDMKIFKLHRSGENFETYETYSNNTSVYKKSFRYAS